MSFFMFVCLVCCAFEWRWLGGGGLVVVLLAAVAGGVSTSDGLPGPGKGVRAVGQGYMGRCRGSM